MMVNVNGYEVKFNRPEGVVLTNPKRLGQTIKWSKGPREYQGKIIGSFYYRYKNMPSFSKRKVLAAGGGYFVLLPSGKIVQCQSSFKKVE